jgi:catenin alpha
MTEASTEFAADPCSLAKRGAMVRAARALLSAVTRLMILADMVDVHLFRKKFLYCTLTTSNQGTLYSR